LKTANFLDLTPFKVQKDTVREEGKIVLLVPKFKNPVLTSLLVPGRKSPHFRIKLDEMGTAVWEEIDGEKPAGDICERLKEKLGEKLQPYDEVEQRVSKFLSRLYEQRYISFRELQK
jgi:hypothetical protein